MSGHGYRYVGKGVRYRGVPARDISQEFFESMNPLDQRTVLTSGAYEPMTVTQAKKAEEKAKADDDGNEGEGN